MPKPLFRGVLHSTVAFCFPLAFALFQNKIGPRLLIMLFTTAPCYVFSGLF